jgi:hypothetical protein
MDYVDLETARAARGVRIVTLGGVPSPWSEAAKALFHVKRIPALGVRLLPGDKELKAWTRASNAPAVIFDDDPARTHWADILELAERLPGAVSLVPEATADRLLHIGLAHEVMGENGLLWAARVVGVHVSLTTDGARGFPVPVARHLGARYGYAPHLVDDARRRLIQAFGTLRGALARGPYYFGERLTALDLYSAAAMNIFAPPPDELCPMLPLVRAGFESMRGDVEVPKELVAHRDLVYARHLELPIRV